ncbi:YceI family protein [Pontibacter vulgaris]|uniref:YceI family protein n=1 Tax=Pontibacter vulgaris TaxID=2905679 RepID=UPI001FA70439|nr:YceI family protein [Pontibacter vulgaris]
MKSITILLLISLLCLAEAMQAQDRYFTKTGHIGFFSEAPLENIEAHNQQVVSILDLKTGELVFSVPMKQFQFRKSLMQTHFNENYVESDKYPKASFKGKVTNIQDVDLKREAVYKVNVKGVLTIHGQHKAIDTVGTLEVKGLQLLGKSKFSVTPQEFGITIPRLVRNNIAKTIAITVDMIYVPFTGKSL